MDVADFDFDLPKEQIAQRPTEARDGARLCVLARDGRAPVEHRAVVDLPELLPRGALVVVNDTRVMAARLFAKKPTGGRVELVRLEALSLSGDCSVWRCIGGASKPIRPGPLTVDGDARIRAEVQSTQGEYVTVRFSCDAPHDVDALLEAVGEIPLPPYITRETAPTTSTVDGERYQTIFATHAGAAAAPTAGLHFTPALIAALEQRGIVIARVTLHVGPGTFSPLRDDTVENNRLHAERCIVSDETAEAINRARAEGRPIVAVGTTVVRTLESAADETGRILPGTRETSMFIYPGYQFRVIDALITNFHLPRSSLLMLVAAFAGQAHVLSAYREAVARGYRFFSYGDAMLIR